MVVVTPKYKGEPIEKMIRRFKAAVKSSGVMDELRKNEYYEKPSIKKRRKVIAAKRKR